jgi:hypothetical protein
MAKLKWYMKYDKPTNSIKIHWLYVIWLYIKHKFIKSKPIEPPKDYSCGFIGTCKIKFVYLKNEKGEWEKIAYENLGTKRKQDETH